MQRAVLIAILLVSLAVPVLAQDAETSLTDTAWLADDQPATAELLDSPPQLEPPAATKQMLLDILLRPEYTSEPITPAGKSWLERFFDWLSQRMSNWGLPNFSGNGLGKWISVLLISTVVVLLVYLVVRIIWAIVNRSSGKPQAKATGGSGPASRDDLLAEAELAAQRGDYAVALRFRFRALIQLIDLPATALLTNHQIGRRLARQCAAATPSFTRLVGQFEDVWYGSQPCSASEFEQATSLAVDVEAMLKHEEDKDAQV